MNILAIDTAGLRLSVAIAKGDRVIAQYSSKRERSHSDMLAPAVERLLKKARLKPKDIDLYAVSIGPGSFTGLRIGVAFIKGMNLFADKPVVCVPTLDVLASGLKADFICPIVDAKRRNVYTTIYRSSESGVRSSEFKRIAKYSVIPTADILEKIKKIIKKGPVVMFVGDGIDVYREEIIKYLGSRAVFAEKRLWYSKAADIAKIGYRMYNDNKGVVRDLAKLAPMYLYPKDIQCHKR